MRIEIDKKYIIDLDRKVGRVGIIDLVCPLRGWFAYHEPIKSIINVSDYMIAGKEVHDVVLSQLREQGCETEKAVEVDSECGRRRFRADAVCNNMIIELKRKYSASLAPLYLWQVKVYMALLNLRRGAVVSLIDGYVKYVTISEEEAEEVRRRLIESLNSMCRDEKPRRRVGKWCRWCKYSRQCLNIQLL